MLEFLLTFQEVLFLDRRLHSFRILYSFLIEQNMTDEIQKLRTDIALNNVLIVIGMHASIYTTNDEQEVAHWKGLIKHGIRQCFLLPHLSTAEFEKIQ